MTTNFEVCGFDSASWLAGEGACAVGAPGRRGSRGAARDEGARTASVTVVNGVPFVYRELFEGDARRGARRCD